MAGTYKCTLSPELQEKAKNELKEKEGWRSRDIQALRDMVLKNKGLRKVKKKKKERKIKF